MGGQFPRDSRSSQEQLRESEQQLRDFVENATVGLHSVDADGRILWANRAELELLGYTAEEYVGRSIIEVHADQDVIADILARLLRGEALHDYEARLRAKDGAIKHVLISSSGYFQDGQFVHSRCFTRDITARRRAEQALRESERQLQTVTDALPVCVSYVDRDRRYQFVSAAYERWFGRPKQELIGRRVEDVVGAPAYAIIGPYIERALAGESVTYQGDVPYLGGGRPRSVEATYIPQFADDQRVVGLVALVSDVSERKAHERFRTAAAGRAERLVKVTAALADAVTTDEVLEAVVDHVAAAVGAANVALWLVDESAGTVALARSVGFDEATVARFAAVSLHAEPSIPVTDAVRRGEPIWIPSQVAMVRDYPHLRDAMRLQRPYRVACLPLGAQRHPIAVLAITIEETGESSDDERSFLLLVARYAGQALERLRLLDAERKSRGDADAAANRLSLLYRFAQAVVAADQVDVVFDAALSAIEVALGTNRAAILLFDGEGVMRFKAWRNLSDTYRGAVEGHSPWQRDATAPQPVLIADVEADASLKAFLPLFHDEGIGSVAFIPLVTRGRLIGKFMVYYPGAHPYSEQEVELASSIANHLASVTARFAAIGKLEDTIRYNELFAGVLAHDLRNPLGAMMTAAQTILLRRQGEAEGNARSAGRIVSSGQRMMRMIDQLLDVTRARIGGGIGLEPCEMNLRALCEQAVGETELAFPQWTIRFESIGELDGTWDPDRLLQIVSNLLSNAGQHGRPQGIVDIKLDGRAADTVTLAVLNGGTIPPAVLPTLFDPFRGSRPRRDAHGLGLGLFIVNEIARAHGGTVEVSSQPESGTTFLVRLPRHTSRSAAFDSDAVERASSGR